MLGSRGIIRVVERCATPGKRVTTWREDPPNPLTCNNGRIVPLAGLEPAACCLGDNCQSSVLYGSVGSGQVRLGGDSVQSGLLRSSTDWWNDRQNDHQCKLPWIQRGRPIRADQLDPL